MALSEPDLVAVEQQADALRAAGWASFVTYEHLVTSWRRLSEEVSSYAATIDDYTNDLTSRSGLELICERCEPGLAHRIAGELAYWDDKFRGGTDPDPDALIGDFYRLPDASAWWFRRMPKTGPLRGYLDDWRHQRDRR